jgi:hypothetical protein
MSAGLAVSAPYPMLRRQRPNWPAAPPNYLHDSWLDYLYWDSELEP